MKNIEIERKYLVKKKQIPFNYKKYKCIKIAQAFIYLKPAIRIRKSNKDYFLTVKNKIKLNANIQNDLARFEYEIPISRKAYNELSKKINGRIIYKSRYIIPYKIDKKKYNIELDVFEKDFKGLIYAEVEFRNLNDAIKFRPPDWFYKDVTGIEKYKNTTLSKCKNVKNYSQY